MFELSIPNNINFCETL